MKHDIECVQNAIECAKLNARDAYVLLTTIQIYDVANMYINDNVISCECETRYIKRIENELRELYTQHIEIETHKINDKTYHCVLSYYDYDQRVFTSMIISTNATNSNFKNFSIIDEIIV